MKVKYRDSGAIVRATTAATRTAAHWGTQLALDIETRRALDDAVDIGHRGYDWSTAIVVDVLQLATDRTRVHAVP